MNANKEQTIRAIIDRTIKAFADDFKQRHISEKSDALGTINSKRNNFLVAELGSEFVFYSAFVRSFDSSFGHVWEDIGNEIASFCYDAKTNIDSFILPEQTQHIGALLDKYEDHELSPEVSHYERYFALVPSNTDSFLTKHACDNWFYDRNTHTHYLIELKLGGDLDNKKAKAEKLSLLKQYFMLKNKVPNSESIKVKFATGYNKFGEGEEWHQSNVERFFASDELLIGKDYWNFVCNDGYIPNSV